MSEAGKTYDKIYWQDGNGRRHKRFVVRKLSRRRNINLGFAVMDTSTGNVVQYGADHRPMSRKECHEWMGMVRWEG
jgi:hypothetical protein